MAARHQHEHDRINRQQYPGTRQLCVKCGLPTDKCEDDLLCVGDYGPLCEACYDCEVNGGERMMEDRPNKREQRELLYDLRDGGGYGILLICENTTVNDVLFAASPVPALRDYEIVCASPERLYDVWQYGKLLYPNQTRKQIRDWIRKSTPKWLYDDSAVTDAQAAMVREWVEDFATRYPGTLRTAEH